MKNKKYILITLLTIILISSILDVNKTYALKRAIFPDGKSLQPMPVDTYANVSGNINSTVETVPIQKKETKLNTPSTPTEPEPIIETKSDDRAVFYVKLITISFLIIFTFIFISRKRRQK